VTAIGQPDRAPESSGPFTLVVDIGGTGTKCIIADASGAAVTERTRLLTPKPATADALLDVIGELVALQTRVFDRVSVGFPGVVRHGVAFNAPNLGSDHWRGVDIAGRIEALTGKPTRVLNDAELQGYGVIEGRGVELVLTLGTGMGVGLYTDGHLVPNLELGHHPFEKGQTYEDRVSDAERKRIGNGKWRRRVARALAQIDPIFNPDVVWVGGGNAKKLRAEELPSNVRTFVNVDGMTGGVRLWGLS